jgi:Ca2+-binding RTX toxin-like protein
VLEITGYDLVDLTFARLTPQGDDIILRLGDGSDEIIIRDALSSEGRGVERILLVDSNVVLNLADVRAQIVAGQSTGGDDLIIGTNGSDVISGGTGDDVITGFGGVDTFVYRAGDGRDRIEGFSADADVLRLEGLNPSDVASAVRGGPDSLDLIVSFANGTDRIILTNALAAGNALCEW